MYKKMELSNDTVTLNNIKTILANAVAERQNSTHFITLGTRDVAVAPLGVSKVLVTSDVRVGWPGGEETRELAAGTLSRIAVFIALAENGLAVSTGYVGLLKFTGNTGFTRYYLEVNGDEPLVTATLKALGFSGLKAEPDKQVNIQEF